MIHLRQIEIRDFGNRDIFPFKIPIIQNWEPLEFSSPVTFLVGENGCGKSTLLEAIACSVGSITIGSESVKTDPTLKQIRVLAKWMKLTWHQRTQRGFFLRAEDFFGYVKQVAQTRADLEQDLERVDRENAHRSKFAQGQTRMAFARELSDIQNRYGEGLDTKSHGESYLELFQGRFVPGGLYLLDEPEAALSPLRQLGFLSLLKEVVAQDAQLIIATHSPILMAYPGAEILSFVGGSLQKVRWEDLEHVTLTRDILNNPEQYLRYL